MKFFLIIDLLSILSVLLTSCNYSDNSYGYFICSGEFILNIILCITITILYRRNKKLRQEKNKLIEECFTLKRQLANEPSNLIVQEEKTIENEPINKLESVKEECRDTIDTETMVKIEEVMDQQQLFLKPDFNLKLLASTLGITQKKIIGTFKNNTQYTNLNDYLNHKRIEYACKKLVDYPDYKVETIAYESGFSSPTTFYRWFEKETGMKPNEYRQSKTPQD